MKALECESRLERENQIQVPPDLVRQIPEGSAVRVIVLSMASGSLLLARARVAELHFTTKQNMEHHRS
jgi:hypothetical protein